MSEQAEYEKELAGHMEAMSPAMRETFVEAVKKNYADLLAELCPNPTRQQIADNAADAKQGVLATAKMGAIFWKKMVEVRSRGLRKDELIHQLVLAEMRYEDAAHEFARMLRLTGDIMGKMHEVLGMDFQLGSASDPVFLGGGRFIKGTVEQQTARMNQIIEAAKHLLEKMQAIKDGYKQRDAFQDRLDFIGIVQRIHEGHTTIQSVINDPELNAYKNKYPGRDTLRGWVKAAIPDRFRPNAKKGDNTP